MSRHRRKKKQQESQQGEAVDMLGNQPLRMEQNASPADSTQNRPPSSAQTSSTEKVNADVSPAATSSAESPAPAAGSPEARQATGPTATVTGPAAEPQPPAGKTQKATANRQAGPASRTGRAPAPAGKAPQAKATQAPVRGMMRRSTAWMGMAMMLILGLYLGSMLPSLQQSTSPQPAGVNMQAQAPQTAPQEQAPQTASQGQAQSSAATSPTPQPAAPAPLAEPGISPELQRQIADAQDALRENPKNAGLWTTLGNLYFDSNQPRLSIMAYEQSLTLVPGNADVLTDLGIMYRQDGQFEKAVEKFRAAVKVAPRHENALFNLGLVLYTDLKRKKEATAAWRQLLKINPHAHASNGQPVSELIRHLH